MLPDIFYKVMYEGSLISSFVASSVTIKALYGFAHICLPAHLSTCVFDEQKKSLYFSWANFTEHAELLLLLPAHKTVAQLCVERKEKTSEDVCLAVCESEVHTFTPSP